MHCYEVIPEGTVCKLYFDLEFYKPANKGADGKVMVSRLIRVCCSIFYFLICYCQSRLLHIQLLHYLSDLLFSYFFQDTKASTESFFGRLQYVCDKLMEVYGIASATCNVLNLDSSTEEKFSRHLIFNLKNAVFKDNIHVGTFRVK